MAIETGEKPETTPNSVSATKSKERVLLLLRFFAFFATLSATIVMALNKETKTLVVGTIGNIPISATVTAKFHHTPAFVFFVIANGMGSLHSLVMISVTIFGQKFDYQGFHLPVIAILDMMTVALVSAGVNAAAFMAELGKNGNSHARWNKICNNFDKFCDHGGGALIVSYIGLGLLLVISVFSILKLFKPKSNNHEVVVP